MRDWGLRTRLRRSVGVTTEGPIVGELPVVKVDLPEAQRLADLASILQDLTFTIEACQRLLDVIDREPQDAVLIQSLWSAALISYVRCFAHGKRFGLSEEILAHLQGEPIPVHNFYKNLRDKHVAHSVNPFEEVAVGVVLPQADSDTKEAHGVAILAMKHIVTDRQGVEQLITLAASLREEVRRMAREAETATREAAKKIPLQELYKKPPLRLYAPGPEKAGGSRGAR